MSVVIGLTPEQQVEFDLILSGMVDPAEAKEISKSIFEEASSGGKKPFKIVSENPNFITVVTVDSGTEIKLRGSSIIAYLSEGYNTKILTDKLEVIATGSVQEFEAFMSQYEFEYGSF